MSREIWFLPAAGRLPWAKLLAFAAVAVFLLQVPVTGNAPARPPLAALIEPHPAATITPHAVRALSPSSASLTVRGTLILANNTLLPGNAPSSWLSYITKTVYDPEDNRTFVISGSDSYVVDINDSNPSSFTFIQVPDTPTDIVYENATDQIVVSEYDYYNSVGYISWINCTDGRLNNTGGLGGTEVLQMAVDPVRENLFTIASSLGSSELLQLGLTHRTSNTAYLPGLRGEIVYDPANEFVYVTLRNVGVLEVYNVSNISNMVLVKTLLIGTNPDGMALDPADSTLFVTDDSSNLTAVIRATNNSFLTNVTSLPLSTDPVYNPVNHTVFLLGSGGPRVYLLNGSNGGVLGSFNTTGDDLGSFDSNLDRLFIASIGNLTVATYSLPNDTLLAEDSLGELPPLNLAFDPANALVYVFFGGSRIALVNGTTDRISRWVTIPGGASSGAYDGATGDMVVFNGSGLLEISSKNGSVVAYHPTGFTEGPGVYDPPTGDLYLIGHNGTIWAVGGTNLTPFAWVGGGSCPWLIADAPADHRVLVLDECSDVVEEINTTSNRLAGSPGGSGSACAPYGMAYDSGTDTVYIANSNCASVDWIGVSSGATGSISTGVAQAVVYDPPAKGILILQTTSHQAWFLADSNNTITTNLRVGGGANSGLFDTADQELFTNNNYDGSLSILVAPLHGTRLVAHPSVVGVNRSISFTTDTTGGVAPLNISYTGLPPGCSSVNASTFSCAPTQLGNYTVNVTVNDSLGGPAVRASATISVVPDLRMISFGASPAIARQGKSEKISVRTSGGTGNVSYTYGGLPAGCASVNLSTIYCTPTVFGNFTLTINATDDSDEQVNSSIQLVVLKAQTFGVAFTEKGLPNGTNWTVNLSGSARSATSSSLAFNVTNGTYTWSVDPIPGYSTTWTGKVTVNGNAASVNLTFSKFNYTLTFSEKGLASGTNWTVTLGSVARSSTSTSIHFIEPNGTYAWSITPIPGYTSTWSGQVTVNGTAPEVAVNFTRVTYDLSFDEAGLLPGTNWTVTVGSTAHSSIAPIIAWTEPNGTYAWSVTPIPGYATNWTGRVTVNANATVVSLVFIRLTYALTFHETGLPNGTQWTVKVGNASFNSAATSIQFLEANGSYPYTLGGIPGWTTSTFSGSVEVTGTPVNLSSLWTRVTYPVLFSENGLPSGTRWWINATGGTSISSTAGLMYLRVPNGSYSYVVASLDKRFASPGGSFQIVGGVAYNITVDFAAVTFVVTFGQGGLPPGTGWWVNVSGGPSTFSNSTSLTLNATNGSFAYSVASNDRVYSSAGGMFTVSGGAAAVSVTFTLLRFGITFSESGLPAGTEWWVNLSAGASSLATAGTVSLELTNGSYSYRVSTTDKTFFSPGGSLLVRGRTSSIPLSFSRVTYAVTFWENGLSPGTNWSVTFDGVTESGTGAITFTGIPNGTYPFTVLSQNGYAVTPRNGSVTVDGGNPALSSISFAQTSGTFHGLPAAEGYAILAVVVLALLVGALVALRRYGGKKSPPESEEFVSEAGEEAPAQVEQPARGSRVPSVE
jgi:hypothetical protein